MSWEDVVAERWPPNDMSMSRHLEHVNVILFWKRVFVDIIKLRISR